MKNLHLIIVAICCFVSSCDNTSKNIPSIGFLDIAEDATLAKARTGFLDALAKNGFSEKDKTLKVYFSNAQGEIAVLNQACDYLISKNVKLIAANSTLSTIAAVQHTKNIAVCMMVAPRPDLAGLTDAQGNYPKNLFGVFETLAYIDSSVALIKRFFPDAMTVGTIYNSSEPQSRDALEELQKAATAAGMKIIAMPVTNSSETQLVTQSLIAKSPMYFLHSPTMSFLHRSKQWLKHAMKHNFRFLPAKQVWLVVVLLHPTGPIFINGVFRQEWKQQIILNPILPQC